VKKYLFICLIALSLTGCKNEIKCSLEQNESVYTIKQEVILNKNENGFVTSKNTTITMIFETEEGAREYYNIFADLEQQSALEIKKNKIIMKDVEEFSEGTKVSEVKSQLEKSGYTCN